MTTNTQKTILLLTITAMIVSIPSAFAEQVTVSLPAGSSVPGCEETNKCYIPSKITIHPGDKVVWSNDDTAAHTVTSGTPANGSDGKFDSSLFMAGTTFSHTFDTLGEYPYYCIVHPWMIGSVLTTVGGGVKADLGEMTIGSGMQSSNSNMISSMSSIKVSDTDLMIGYTITSGNVVSVMPDVDTNSLIIGINADKDGIITLELPRSVLDAKMNNNDDEFFVLVDGEEVNYDESVTKTHRTLSVSFPAGTDEIEIIGTFVIPEFGTIAAMILAIATISIIAISAKSRLSVMPRL
ncbi:MAG: PEFG-CTERM sorting domain-containing protein [Nitrosopumilus sp.]|nr:PEFG-CTERM sorting domain-containing protein [Nitrosopumilus sp.]MDH3490145.1 PEFG-CTERM sorting domain-containing protein [Nitrosopumilus sp.]MDH3516884.1 PEFG-CTERM sorting domain-containing protein [Nitrosopumilus sp.]MDH3565258.1 PEFG-CTERM sorting domain-containing protein [Nitrosopumilus sp.]MDH5418019.1 PEFG-CTERM sorting domain-containing protein [Nitrosopumilus sp.]